MRIAVDVKKVIQEIDLDTGITSNFLVFMIGNHEHVVPATEHQLKDAVREASLLLLHTEDGRTLEEVVLEAPDFVPEAPVLGAVGEIPSDHSTFVSDLLEEPIGEEDNPFAEVNLPVTEEEMREYHTGGESVLPLRVDISSDDKELATTFADITRGATEPKSLAPASPTRQRQQNIQERTTRETQGPKEVLATLRKKARTLPPRRLAPHQVDEAGNPIPERIPQKGSPAPAPAAPLSTEGPEVQVFRGPAPAGFDGDGFEQG